MFRFGIFSTGFFIVVIFKYIVDSTMTHFKKKQSPNNSK